VCRSFLQRVNRGELDLEAEYIQFNALVSEYEKLLALPIPKFTPETILTLFEYYKKLINIAYVCFDAVEVIDELDKEKREWFAEWSTKTRRREEVIYKNGEMKFIPKYLSWLAANHLPRYTVEQLKYLLYPELVAYVQHHTPLPSPEELEQRMKWLYVCQCPERNMEYHSGEQAEEIINKKQLLRFTDNVENITQLKGQSAQRGHAVGKVRIVRARQDMEQFSPGEILVSPMTDPSYLPIMKKAAAFITNEGGTLCHAAIVARELKKPCVIGTKIATHALMDGDIVEVDGDKGIVIIMQRVRGEV
ncbi:MAG: PEP-utilizing enzyme, partial [Nanoarchaeota archaeon]